MEKRRKKFKGKVVSDKMMKSIVVRVEELRTHPIYKKKIKWSNQFIAHDEKNEAKEGDVVEIVETRPLSKLKNYTLSKLIEKKLILNKP